MIQYILRLENDEVFTTSIGHWSDYRQALNIPDGESLEPWTSNESSIEKKEYSEKELNELRDKFKNTQLEKTKAKEEFLALEITERTDVKALKLLQKFI